MTTAPKELFAEKVKRVNDAIALKEPDAVPLTPSVSGAPFYLSDYATYKDTYL